MNQSASKTQSTGILLACSCLILIGAMPVIANARPDGTSALAYTLILSLWQLLFSLPLALRDWLALKPVRSEQAPGLPVLPLRGIASKKHLLILAGTGLLFGISTYFYILAAEKAGAVSSAIAIQVYPLFAILLESLFLGRRKNVVELGLTFALIGVLTYLATEGTWRLESLSFWFVFALSIPLIWSIAHVSLREVMIQSRLTPGLITCLRVFVSSILLLVCQLVAEGGVALMAVIQNIDFLLSAALMGIVYYTELVLWFHAARRIDISLASSITVPAPALTMIFAFVFLGEHVTDQQIIALGAIVICLYGLIYASQRKARKLGRA